MTVKGKKQKAKQNHAEPVIFVEGGIVQALLMPSDIEKTGYRHQTYELVDYDAFGDHDEENIFFMWEGLSDRLKKYFDKCLPDEKQKFLDRIQQWQDRLDAEAKEQPKSHSADLDDCEHTPNNPDTLQSVCTSCGETIFPKSPDSDEWVTEGGAGMEIMRCDVCDAELEDGRIGKCDDCLSQG
jgi:hypothetical protein